MNTAQQVRRPTPGPSKMMRVAPTVTDPSMQSNRSQADAILSEMGETTDDVENVVFNRKKPTKEELDQQAQQPAASTDNTTLIIIFALTVIALVALIIWMIMKSGPDKKEEDEVRRMIQPHPRNGMPPMTRHPINQQQYNQMQAMRRQQQMQQQQQYEQEDDQDDQDEPPQRPPQRRPPQQKQQKRAGPPPVSTTGVVVGVTAEQKALSDKAEAEAEAQSNFTKEKPHPAIMKPGVVAKNEAVSEVDDIMNRTTAMLNAQAPKPAKPQSNGMTDADRALLDKVNAEHDEEDDDDDEEDV